MPERWWHTIDLPGGATDGWWDLRQVAPKLPWPDIAGKRCIDVGTADGYWAFELERRGAASVLVTDRRSFFQSECRARFEEAYAKLGSRVEYEERRAGWTVVAQTGILRDGSHPGWKERVGVRGRACAIHARQR